MNDLNSGFICLQNPCSKDIKKPRGCGVNVFFSKSKDQKKLETMM
jgi:hypothetical protein